MGRRIQHRVDGHDERNGLYAFLQCQWRERGALKPDGNGRGQLYVSDQQHKANPLRLHVSRLVALIHGDGCVLPAGREHNANRKRYSLCRLEGEHLHRQLQRQRRERRAANQTKTYGAPLTLSATKPTRAGHTFLGWNTKADGSGTSYAAGGSYTANAAATLYAQWQANAYAVAFDAQGGSVTPASKSVTYGQPYGALPVPERPGYRFDGWFTAAAGGTQVTAETVVTVTAAQTLYAHWTVQSIVHVKGADGALHDGIVTVKGADGAMHVGIVYVKGPDGNLHVNG